NEGSTARSVTRRFVDGGGSAFQFDCLLISPRKIGITSTGGSVVSFLSPQVTSKLTSMLKNRIERLPVPLASHGVGPESWKFRLMLSRSMPNTEILSEPDIWAMNMNGENWKRTSRPSCPVILAALTPKNRYKWAPN